MLQISINRDLMVGIEIQALNSRGQEEWKCRDCVKKVILLKN